LLPTAKHRVDNDDSTMPMSATVPNMLVYVGIADGIDRLALDSSHSNVWWQLPEVDHHSFRVVYFHTVHVAKGDQDKAVVAWLRWAAVRQAKTEQSARRRSWRQAYDVASARLTKTVAEGGWVTMKTTYFAVQRLLKAQPV
jgi:hypothetical protein